MSIETRSDSDEEEIEDEPQQHQSKWPRYHAVCRDCEWSLLLVANSKMIESISRRHREQHEHRTAYKQIETTFVDDEQNRLHGGGR